MLREPRRTPAHYCSPAPTAAYHTTAPANPFQDLYTDEPGFSQRGVFDRWSSAALAMAVLSTTESFPEVMALAARTSPSCAAPGFPPPSHVCLLVCLLQVMRPALHKAPALLAVPYFMVAVFIGVWLLTSLLLAAVVLQFRRASPPPPPAAE